MKPMKHLAYMLLPAFTLTFMLTFLLTLFVPVSLSAQDADDWRPQELREMEEKFLELQAQVDTLDQYKPEEMPDYDELEKTNQMVEKLDFNRRQFALLIKLYNQVEDKAFPFLLKYSQDHPELTTLIYNKVKEYEKGTEKSLLEVQSNINKVALAIERLEKNIERIQITSRDKELEQEKAKKLKEISESLSISVQIQMLEEERRVNSVKIEAEEARLKELKEKEEKEAAKIKEKQEEIKEFRKTNRATRNRVERLINRISSNVREERLNGLEIPRLNTTKTFVYLANTTLETFRKKNDNIDREIELLKTRRQKEIIDRLIKGAIVVVIAVFLVFLLMGIARRVSKKILRRIETSEKLDAHRKQRYHTLSSVILSAVKVLLWIMAVLSVLDILNIDIGPFLVAAGGISLAIGFGAQSLVKDVVTGFFLLMEEQFALGDSIELGGKSGTVEKISLRTIKFRGLDGTLHIMPNGSITSVSNMTYQWSRAIVKVGVSYDEKPERVLEVMNNIGKEFAADPEWKDKLLDEPTSQGILDFGDSAINFRLLVKTNPGDQWAVGRELCNRIKNTFDKEGIDIPYNIVKIVNDTENQPEK